MPGYGLDAGAAPSLGNLCGVSFEVSSYEQPAVLKDCRLACAFAFHTGG